MSGKHRVINRQLARAVARELFFRVIFHVRSNVCVTLVSMHVWYIQYVPLLRQRERQPPSVDRPLSSVIVGYRQFCTQGVAPSSDLVSKFSFDLTNVSCTADSVVCGIVDGPNIVQ